ncbi:MAG TPA: polyprenyl synthetase family protein [Gammaproteobacteria bacterium]|nr:polyprenyl synthetase family protein [Gammaproteobacteria bacterium]
MPLESIRALVRADLEATDKFICAELSSEIPLINQLVEYILTCGGKRVRPLIVLLTARALNHSGQQHIDLAAAIELIHTATLLHDDVVDSSTLRRGNKTANNIWGNEASVLVGDFLYSRAFQLIVKLKNLEILDIFASATNLIAEGEVLQLINCHDPDTTEQAYYDVISRKTAKLFEVASQSGAALCQYEAQQMAAMQHYGISLGTAFQLIDDALDYSSSAEEMGKNMGNDLSEGKPTLPLIHALRSGTKVEAKLIRKAIKAGSTKDIDSILTIIESTGAIEYTANAAKQLAQQATNSLIHIPESPYRQALHDLAEFVVARKY